MNFNKLSALGAALILQLITVNAQASEISGVGSIQTGGSNNIYNIKPDKINNSGFGFKQYDKFELSNGDVANFIMTDLSKFVNLVDSKVSINGLVNTVNSDMSKSNSGLVFISPEGFVVGSTGVLNVGSLSVYTPDSTSYQKYSSDLKNSIADNTEFLPETGALTYGKGVITIDGSLITNGDINLNSNTINITKDAHVVSGINTDKTFITKNPNDETLTYTKPEDIFYSLVNTSQMSTEASNINLSTNGGDINIGGLVESRNGDINIDIKDGNLVNAGSTDILLSAGNNLNISVTGKNAGNVGEIPVNTSNSSDVATRDFSKSINVKVGGDVNINAENSVNLTSIDNDLVINQINAGDVVYLTVDKTNAFTGETAPGIYSSKNHKAGTPNVTAGGTLSIMSAGNVGSKDNGGRFTLSSTSESQKFNTESWNTDKFNYAPNLTDAGIEVISNQGDIYIQNTDKSSNVKNLTAKDGSVDAQFAGKTYINNVSATQNVNVLTQGDVLYVNNLDITNPVDSILTLDETGSKEVHFTALGLGDDTADSSDSIIILKNGKVQGTTPVNIEFMGDNIYADGKYANLGKNSVGSTETLTVDGNTSAISAQDGSINVTYSTVTEDAVNSIDNPAGINSEDSNAKAVVADDDIDFGDTDTDNDNDDIGNIGDGDTDDDGEIEPPITSDSDDDNDSGNNEPSIGDTDDDSGDDIGDIGSGDTDDDVEPPVSGDTDIDNDDDIPAGDTDDDVEPPVSGDTDIDNDDDIPAGDTDDDVEPPVSGDTDIDNDDDIPAGDTDDDEPPITGDTDIDNDDDIPGTKPINPPDIDPLSPVPEKFTINTEPKKPMSIEPEIGTNNITTDEDIENESPVNSNGLFLDNDTDTDVDIDKPNKINSLRKKKHKFFFRYRFK